MRRLARIPGALIAARFSTDNQSEDSIEIQVEKCTEYCREHGIPVLDVYADAAVSGMKLHRPQLDRMLDDLRAGKGDTVVILDQSRMIRNMPRWFSLRQEIAAMGVRVISVTQPFVGGDIRDPNTYMMEGQTAMINHMWVLLTRQKVLAKMHRMAKAGYHTGGKPALGYRVQHDILPSGEQGPGYLVIDEDEAVIVRRIFTEYASGRSYKAIIDGLNADGIRTKRGSAYGSNSLHDLLKNEKYIGTLVYGSKVYRPDGSRNSHSPEGTDVVRIEGAIPAIIDKDTFRKVQERMAINKHEQGGRPGEVRSYPLRGKVFCGECGAAMHVRTSKGPKNGDPYFYYACSRKKNKHEQCPNKPIRADELEQLVIEHVRAILGSPKVLKETMERIQTVTGEMQRTGAQRMEALVDQIFDIDAQIANIVNAIAAGAYSAALQERLTALEADKAKLTSRMAEMKKAADIASLPVEQLDSLFGWIVEAAQTDTAAVFSVVSRVEIYHDKIVIYTAFDPDDPNKRTTAAGRESIKTMGTPSGVPRVFITAAGLGLIVGRNS